MHMVELTVNNELGLHARAAGLFASTASKFSSKIVLIKDDKEYNGKSVLGILSVGAGKGTEVTIKAEGTDELAAIEALTALVKSNFGE